MKSRQKRTVLQGNASTASTTIASTNRNPFPPELQNPFLRQLWQQADEYKFQDAIDEVLVAVGVAKHIQYAPLNLIENLPVTFINSILVIRIVIISITSLFIATRRGRRHHVNRRAATGTKLNARSSGRCASVNVWRSTTPLPLTAGLRPRSGSGPAGPGCRSSCSCCC